MRNIDCKDNTMLKNVVFESQQYHTGVDCEHCSADKPQQNNIYNVYWRWVIWRYSWWILIKMLLTMNVSKCVTKNVRCIA